MRALALALAASLAACAPASVNRRPASGVMTGLDTLVADGFKPFRGRRVALITGRSGVDRRGRASAGLFAAASGVTLAAVFSPETGYAFDSIESMRLSPERLRGFDALIFDAQDSGARFDTTLASMAMALESAKAANIDFVVLDRPNPIRGDVIEGPILADPDLRLVSPQAYFQVPVRHGLTAGEMALWHNLRVRHAHLKVIPLRGWSRDMWYDETGLPPLAPASLPGSGEVLPLYAGIGLFAASNLSVGAGTDLAHRWIGAPWLRAEEIVARLSGLVEGVEFSSRELTPRAGPYAGRLCPGVLVSVTDRDAARPLAVFRRLALAVRELHSARIEWRWDEAERLIGTREFRLLWETGADDAAFLSLFDKGPRDFAAARRSVLLY